MEPTTASEHLELLVFELAGVRYGLELRVVREVLRAVLIAPLPDAPLVIEGIIDLRGQLVPVFDVRARFGLPPRPLDPAERLVVAWTGTRTIAFRCERTEWVENVDRSTVGSPESVGGAGRHITGVARMPDGLVLIQDLEAFLDASESDNLDTALAAHAERAAE